MVRTNHGHLYTGISQDVARRFLEHQEGGKKASKFLRDNGIEGKPHGFRASFRTWVQDNDTASWDVAETVLGHSIGGKTERAYARSDLLERRRPVMQAWAEYVAGRSDARPSSEVL